MLTRDEVHKLENSNFDVIDLKTPTKKYYYCAKTARFFYNDFSEASDTKMSDERINEYLANFFSPYWEKRVD